MTGARAPAPPVDRWLAAAEAASRRAAQAGGWLMLAAAVLVSVDVLARKLARVTVGGADELSGYALAIGSSWSLAHVLLARGNVRIDALYRRLRPAAAAVCDVLALAALAAFVGVVAWYGAGVVAQSWASASRSNSALQVPLVVPQALWWAGCAWFIAVALLLALRAAAPLARGDWARVRGLIGARGIEEEAADELADALAAAGMAPAAAAGGPGDRGAASR